MRPKIFNMLFHDEWMFVLELSPVETRTGNEPPKNEWGVITRRNVPGYERIRGSHHIFTKNGVEEILSLQPKGNKSKPYQVKQVRNVIVKYKLGGDIDV